MAQKHRFCLKGCDYVCFVDTTLSVTVYKVLASVLSVVLREEWLRPSSVTSTFGNKYIREQTLKSMQGLSKSTLGLEGHLKNVMQMLHLETALICL